MLEHFSWTHRENFFHYRHTAWKNAIEKAEGKSPSLFSMRTHLRHFWLGKKRGITNKNGSKVFVQILYLFINKAAKLHALRESIFIALATTKHDKITEFRLDKKFTSIFYANKVCLALAVLIRACVWVALWHKLVNNNKFARILYSFAMNSMNCDQWVKV